MIICPNCKTENANNCSCCIQCGKTLQKSGNQEGANADVQQGEAARLTFAGKEASSNGDFQQAVTFYLQAAELGDAEAQYDLGLLYMEGKGVKKDEKAAAGWIQKAADQGHNEATRKLAWCYLYGRGVKQSLTKSVKLSQQASGKGDQIDMNKYGLLVRK